MNNIFGKIVLATVFSALSLTAFAIEGKCTRTSSDSLTVTLVLERPNLKLGAKIPVRVSIENVGESVLLVPALMEAENYWLRFEIVDSTRKVLPFTGAEIKKMYQINTVSLLPGHFYGVKIVDLSEFYNVAKPGVYFVQAVYGLSPLGECKMGKIRSPVMKLTVV